MSYQRGNKVLAALGVDTQSIIQSYTKRNLNRKPENSFDGLMYDAIRPYLERADKRLAEQVYQAILDDRITKNFCEESKLYEQVERFTDVKTFRRSMQGKDAYVWAWHILRSMFPNPEKNQLTPLTLDESTDVVSIFSNPDASAGYLAYPKHKREVPDLIKTVALEIMKSYDKTISFPAIALTRAQITDFIDEEGNLAPENIKYKTRLVMCVDAASVLVEQTFGQPILDCILKAQPQYAGGKDDYEIRNFLLRTCTGKRWVSLDYSKFDATIQGWLIKDVFSFLSEYYSEEHRLAFEWMTNNFINMQLLMPDGSLKNLHKGIKSGSYFTQIVGSICNILMILTYFCYKFGEKDGKRILNVDRVYKELSSNIFPNNRRYLTIMSMGDDNIFFTRSKIDMKELSSYLFYNFGAIVTIEGEKGFDEGSPYDKPHFLKRLWTFQGQYREDLDMFINLLHPERKRSYDGFSPWHILFGYYLTFEGSMRRYFPKLELLELMDHNGGIGALSDIKLRELPGSLRSQIMNRGVSRDYMVQELNRDYKLMKAG